MLLNQEVALVRPAAPRRQFSPFYDVIDTFSRRRYFFRKLSQEIESVSISDLELGVHKRGIVGAVATVFS
jgi:hypothetical protein